jgi:hypothetical protein
VLRQFSSSEDRSHDPEYTLAPFVHVLKFISFALYSPAFRGTFDEDAVCRQACFFHRVTIIQACAIVPLPLIIETPTP